MRTQKPIDGTTSNAGSKVQSFAGGPFTFSTMATPDGLLLFSVASGRPAAVAVPSNATVPDGPGPTNAGALVPGQDQCVGSISRGIISKGVLTAIVGMVLDVGRTEFAGRILPLSRSFMCRTERL